MGERSRLPNYSHSTRILAVRSIAFPLISVARLQCEKSIELSRHPQTSSDVRADSDGGAMSAHYPAFSPWAASAWAVTISNIPAIAKNIIIGLNRFTCLAYVGSYERNQPHFFNDLDQRGILLRDWVKTISKPSVALSPFHQNGFLNTDWDSEKWRETLTQLHSILPTLFLRVGSPNLIAFDSHHQGLFKHLIQNIIIFYSDSAAPFNKTEHYFMRTRPSFIHQLC